MFLVHGLASDPKLVSDGLPRPTQAPSVLDVQLLELFDELTQRSDCAQPDGWVAAIHRVVQANQLTHVLSA